jgi:predicted DNA-binding transcriptional regulator AlpA
VYSITFYKKEELRNNYVRGVYIIKELNDGLFKSHRLHQGIKKILCPRRGLNHQEAAIYVGVSPSLFDDLVKSGEMPKPLRINRRTVWDNHQLDECFDALFAPDDNPADELRYRSSSMQPRPLFMNCWRLAMRSGCFVCSGRSPDTSS